MRQFRNWGSSSIECLRMNFPMRVTRGSSLILKSGPSASFRSASSARRSSASLCMERNLYMSKVRIWPSRPMRPTRFCEYRGVPGLSRRMAAHRTIEGIRRTAIATSEKAMSKARFTKR